jgi:hypothetical protein
MYRIEIQKDTYTILKIFLSRDTKYRFIFLSICIVSNKILTFMVKLKLDVRQAEYDGLMNPYS